jgi:hypothetical protein
MGCGALQTLWEPLESNGSRKHLATLHTRRSGCRGARVGAITRDAVRHEAGQRPTPGRDDTSWSMRSLLLEGSDAETLQRLSGPEVAHRWPRAQFTDRSAPRPTIADARLTVNRSILCLCVHSAAYSADT